MDIAPISRTPPPKAAEPTKLEQLAVESPKAQTLATKDLYQFQRAEDPSRADKSSQQGADASTSKEAAQATKEAVEALNEKALAQQRSLRFKVHDDTGQMVVSLVDSKSDEVIRQIPTEEALKLAEALAEQEQGLESLDAGAVFETAL